MGFDWKSSLSWHLMLASGSTGSQVFIICLKSGSASAKSRIWSTVQPQLRNLNLIALHRISFMDFFQLCVDRRALAEQCSRLQRSVFASTKIIASSGEKNHPTFARQCNSAPCCAQNSDDDRLPLCAVSRTLEGVQDLRLHPAASQYSPKICGRRNSTVFQQPQAFRTFLPKRTFGFCLVGAFCTRPWRHHIIPAKRRGARGLETNPMYFSLAPC